MLLTKEERTSLSKEERKALRAERRAERKAERGPFLGIDLKVLEPLAEDIILEIAADAIPGEDKMQEVLDELALQADSFLKWNGLPTWVSVPLEIIDGLILQAIVRSLLEPLVQKVYDRLKEAGKLEP